MFWSCSPFMDHTATLPFEGSNSNTDYMNGISSCPIHHYSYFVEMKHQELPPVDFLVDRMFVSDNNSCLAIQSGNSKYLLDLISENNGGKNHLLITSSSMYES